MLHARHEYTADKCTSGTRYSNYDDKSRRRAAKRKRISDLYHRDLRRASEGITSPRKIPLGLAGGLNVYGFVGGDPVTYSDPFGLCPKEQRGNCTQADVSCADVKAKLALAAVGLTVSPANAIPATFARVVPGSGPLTSLAKPGESEAWVTDAKLLRGLSASKIQDLLRIRPDATGYRVIEFPSSSASNIASPVFRPNEGFVGGGKTGGGAPEWVIRNEPIPEGATIRTVPPDFPVEIEPGVMIEPKQ